MTATDKEKGRILSAGYRTNVRNWLRHHARMIKQAHAKAERADVKRKYEWLAQYHNEVAAKYTTSPLVICNLRRSREPGQNKEQPARISLEPLA